MKKAIFSIVCLLVLYTVHAKPKPTTPVINTTAASFIGGSFVTTGGSVTNAFGNKIVTKGICWNISPNPTVANFSLIATTDGVNFDTTISSLTPNTTYYVRAFATNNKGETGYGNEISFTTTKGNSTYTIVKKANATADELDAYAHLKTAFDSAVWYYNHYTSLAKVITVQYVPGVPTADGNNNGYIRFGSTRSYMEKTRAMHEMAHTFGCGTTRKWTEMMINGKWQGKTANLYVQNASGNATDSLHGDKWHFWPGGLNYLKEYKSTQDLIDNCKLVEAMISDGL